MGNTGTMSEPPSLNVEDRLTVLPDYMEREEGDKIFAHRDYYNICKVKNIGISECKTYLRLKFILAKYMKWLLNDEPKTINNGMYEMINHELNSNKYNNIELLNDYHHLLFTHYDQFEDIYNYLKINCKINFCSAMWRNYRDKHYYDKMKDIRSKLYFGYTSSKEINLLQILDKIHCHFLHSFEMGFDILKSDLMTDSDELKYANKNFKVDGYIGFGELHEELSTADINEIFKEKADKAYNDDIIRNTKKIVYEKSKVIHDLSIYQSQNGINGFDIRENNKFVTDLHLNHISETNEKEKKYTFGDRYCYWDYYEYDYWYIPYKYETIKDELLLNEFASISYEQFNDLIERAECYIKTKHCRKIMCMDKRGRPYYGIAKRELISIQHLISLFIYCNFNKLQRCVRNTYIRNMSSDTETDDESDDEIKIRHSMYHHLGKYIRESVEVFGVNAYQSNINNFYHAITSQIPLIHNGIYINNIISCTSKLSVSIYYCSPYLSESTKKDSDIDLNTKFNTDNDTDINNLDILDDNTLILNFNSGSSFYYYSAKYFDCHWLSDFSNEMECLFVGNDKPLYIKSILYPSQSFNYRRYINAIKIIKNMIRGLWFYSLSENQIVFQLLSINNNNNDNKIPKYMQTVFNQYKGNVFEIDINHEAMMYDIKDGTLCQKGYKFLKHLFYDKTMKTKTNDDGDDDEKGETILHQIYNIKLQLICDIFPNLKRIFIDNIELSDKFMKCLLNFLEKKGSNNLLKHKVEEINIYNITIQEDTMNIDQYIEKYWQQFDDVNFRMHKQSIYNDFLCFHKEEMTDVSDLW